jgi:hypothetical protein
MEGRAPGLHAPAWAMLGGACLQAECGAGSGQQGAGAEGAIRAALQVHDMVGTHWLQGSALIAPGPQPHSAAPCTWAARAGRRVPGQRVSKC